MGDRRRAGAWVRWLGIRAVGVVAVLWAVATLTFFGMRLIPGDPALAILGGPGSQAGPEALALVRRQYGLDLPLIQQYARALGRYATGDLGTSYGLHEPVASVIGTQLPGTLVLALVALVLAWVIAVAAVVLSTRTGRFGAVIASGLEITAAAVPEFWLATVLVTLFATWWGVLPAVSVAGPVGLILPAVTLAVPLSGFLGQVMREPLVDAAASPFVLSARARGEGEVGVVLRHTLRHAAVPAVSLTGWAFGALISGSVVVETVFARPGLGRTLLGAVQSRDVPLVGGVVLVVALGYVVATFAGEAAERLLDPRLGTEPA